MTSENDKLEEVLQEAFMHDGQMAKGIDLARKTITDYERDHNVTLTPDEIRKAVWLHIK